jgi:hypothetical protein
MIAREPEVSDEWFLEPRASDDMQLGDGYFKAFGRMFIRKTCEELDESGTLKTIV